MKCFDLGKREMSDFYVFDEIADRRGIIRAFCILLQHHKRTRLCLLYPMWIFLNILFSSCVSLNNGLIVFPELAFIFQFNLINSVIFHIIIVNFLIFF